MPRPAKRPGYDPATMMKELQNSIVELYLNSDVPGASGRNTQSLRKIGDELDLNPIKVRKLLITAGVYRSDTADKVLALYRAGKTIPQIMEQTGLSRSSVHSYLPYTKIAYNAKECSVAAERIRKYRERKAAVERLSESFTEDNLWAALLFFQEYPFYTAKGLKFTYTIRGNEIFFDRKKKSITRATVDLAFQKTIELHRKVTGPKKLGCFGASYIFPVLIRLGVIEADT